MFAIYFLFKKTITPYGYRQIKTFQFSFWCIGVFFLGGGAQFTFSRARHFASAETNRILLSLTRRPLILCVSHFRYVRKPRGIVNTHCTAVNEFPLSFYRNISKRIRFFRTEKPVRKTVKLLTCVRSKSNSIAGKTNGVLSAFTNWPDRHWYSIVVRNNNVICIVSFPPPSAFFYFSVLLSRSKGFLFYLYVHKIVFQMVYSLDCDFQPNRFFFYVPNVTETIFKYITEKIIQYCSPDVYGPINIVFCNIKDIYPGQ